jgi:hypothetical protein
MTAREHNRLVGIFLMAHGGMQAVVMIILSIIYGVLGAAFAIGGRGEEKVMGAVFIGMIVFLSIFTVFFAGSQILGGYKLFREKANARTWGVVASIVSCLSFPLGTAAGVYGLWFLFGEEGKRFYLGGPTQHAYLPNDYQSAYKPPPPGNWQ